MHRREFLTLQRSLFWLQGVNNTRTYAIKNNKMPAMLITRNEVTFLYVLLECFKWISTYFKANNAISPYNIDLL